MKRLFIAILLLALLLRAYGLYFGLPYTYHPDEPKNITVAQRIFTSTDLNPRFYNDPERYSKEIEKYENLFSSFELVKIFTDGGYEVRIYEIKNKNGRFTNRHYK